MKRKTLLSSLLLLLLGFNAISQTTLDTVKLNKDLSATLEFDTDISFVIFGNNPQVGVTPDGNPIYKYYDLYQDGNVAIFRVKPDAPFTTLDIKLTNGILFHGYITASKNITKTLYKFKSSEVLQEKKIKMEEDSAKKSDEEITGKLNQIKGMKHDFEDIGIIKNGLIFNVVNMVNDKKYMYIRVLLTNKTSNLYEVDGVTFKMTEGKKKSLKKKELANQNWLAPVKTIYPEDKQIKAFTNGYIYFAVPMYSISTGNLIIKVIEKNGNRTGDIQIDADNLNRSKVF
jgi:hypothetical protein